MKIDKTDIPKDSLVNEYLPSNYSDAYCCNIKADKEITADDVQVALWTSFPNWIEWLFKVRNSLVKIVGLKGSKVSPETIKDCIYNSKDQGMFSITGKTENETTIKLSDKHLDAYMSVYILDKEKEIKSIYLITVVNMHSKLGYIYFYAIMPFHKVVIKGMLKHFIKQMKS